MEYVIDLHVHSHYSRATSRQSTLEGLYSWGKIKGINIIGTGDFTHPGWFAEMREKLEPVEGGLFRLKSALAAPLDALLPESIRSHEIRFVPTVEISTIYGKGGKVRKLHQLIVMPDFKGVSELSKRLSRIGNLTADGRPILGLDSKELLRYSLDADSRSLFIAAHIWTPWFGLFGSKSGFDSLSEAYEELTPEMRVVETGLSSDPAMNWRIKDLDNLTITSHSDAHSPQKLGREATVINSGLSYDDCIGALKENDERMAGTIEFFPQEGKYHADGHRSCGICFTSEQTKAHHGICPICHKPLVIGVNYRVNELASRPIDFQPKTTKKVEYIIPLPEVVAELKGLKGTASKTVTEECQKIYHALGDEFTILRKLPITQIQAAGFNLLAVAIQRIRSGEVIVRSGYDGVYGVIRVFKDDDERQELLSRLS